MTNTALFHLGYPKCASTFLQVKVFPLVHSASYIGLQVHRNITGTVKSSGSYSLSEKQMAEHKSLIDFLSGIGSVSLDEERALLQYFSNLRSDNNLIISDENFLDFRYNNTAFEQRIENLKSVFTEGDNIIVFTKPLIDILVSMYRDHPITYIEREKLCTFEQFVSSKDVQRQPILLNQKKVIAELRKNFGYDQVLEFGVDDLKNLKFENYLKEKLKSNIRIEHDSGRINAGASSVMFEYRILKQKLKFLRSIIPRAMIDYLDDILLKNIKRVTQTDKKNIDFNTSEVFSALAESCDLTFEDIFSNRSR